MLITYLNFTAIRAEVVEPLQAAKFHSQPEIRPVSQEYDVHMIKKILKFYYLSISISTFLFYGHSKFNNGVCLTRTPQIPSRYDITSCPLFKSVASFYAFYFEIYYLATLTPLNLTQYVWAYRLLYPLCEDVPACCCPGAALFCCRVFSQKASAPGLARLTMSCDNCKRESSDLGVCLFRCETYPFESSLQRIHFLRLSFRYILLCLPHLLFTLSAGHPPTKHGNCVTPTALLQGWQYPRKRSNQITVIRLPFLW
jgi:hypothetical protein